MFKMLIATLAAIAPGAVINAAETTLGTAECVPHANGSGCAIGWSFTRSPRAFVQVEYLDENSAQWRPQGQPYDSVHTRSNPVPPGRLYRVRGCDDAAVKRNCITSTVNWAIERPEAEEIPDFLVDGNGVEMQIVKSAPMDVQIAQYNVYRLVQLLDRIPDVSQLPPMTRPNNDGVAGASEDAQILEGVYENYTARREQAMSSDKRRK